MHATCVGGMVIEGGSFDWQKYADKFPGMVEPDESYHGLKFYEKFGKQAFCVRLRAVMLRDLGCTMEKEKKDFSVENLRALGLGNIDGVSFGKLATAGPIGAFGKLRELSKGKDTITGHWEIAGVETATPFKTYPDGFPKDFMPVNIVMHNARIRTLLIFFILSSPIFIFLRPAANQSSHQQSQGQRPIQRQQPNQELHPADTL